MAQPVLVRAYTINEQYRSRRGRRGDRDKKALQTLPPISSFAFADILRAADSPELQKALDGIADICAKNRLSLADEYGSHLPPLGEITAAAAPPTRSRMHMRRGMRVALTSVPEVSSGSSEGGSSRKSKKRGPAGGVSGGGGGGGGGIFSFSRRRRDADANPLRSVRIGEMGRSIPVGSTTALALDHATATAGVEPAVSAVGTVDVASERSAPRTGSSGAEASLQRLLTTFTRRLRPG